MPDAGQTFVSEAITPLVKTADTNAMAGGGPGLPSEFTWRGEKLEVATVVRSWRETAPCKHGGDEKYARKHWYEVQITDGRKAKIYFERQARGRNLKKRWWLFTIEDNDAEDSGDAR